MKDRGFAFEPTSTYASSSKASGRGSKSCRSPCASGIDELRELKNLLELGLLSQKEFAHLKTKLLRGD